MSPLDARIDGFEELRWTFSNEDRITATLSLYFRGCLMQPIVTVYIRGKAKYTQSASGWMLNKLLGFPEGEDTNLYLRKLLKPMLPKEDRLTEENLEPIRSYIEMLTRLSKGN